MYTSVEIKKEIINNKNPIPINQTPLTNFSPIICDKVTPKPDAKKTVP
jgi:hypothetical protein